MMKNIIKKRAFTLIELMMSISILAIIMVAVGIALNASVMNYEANRDISQAVIKANQAVSRITADLRCATIVQTSEANSQCSMFTSDGSNITYSFDQAQGKLFLTKNGTSYTLCSNISSGVFIKEISGSNVKSVQILLTVTVGGFSQNACAAVVIRKNM